MKAAIAIAVASAAVANAVATPARVEVSANKVRAASVPTVTVKGNAFFAGNERFYIRGVDYQPGGSSATEDPIANTADCRRDVAEFKKLGINTVRVYTVDNKANHDACMSALADAGIYLALDVNTPKYSLNRADVAASYNDVYLQSLFATIDAFAKYDNTLLFFSGNEVINADNNTDCAPYVKAVTRDMKQCIGSRGHRSIPVGYSAADVESNRHDMATYMNCGPEDQRSDFFAFNDYSWCDPSSYTTSGWNKKVAQYGDYSIPLFLSEYGCITNDRQFQEVSAHYDSQMTPVYSGGLVYEYSEEGSGYGLVNINGNSITETSELSALQKQLAANVPSGDGDYKANGSPSRCPTRSSTWEVKAFTGEDLPAMPSGARKYMSSGAGDGPGLKGAGSQNAGGASSGTATPGSGAVTATASGSTASGSASSSSSAAKSATKSDVTMMPLLVCGCTVVISMLFGASLL